jgi:hypothetical protein
VNWTELAQDRVQWLAVAVSTAMAASVSSPTAPLHEVRPKITPIGCIQFPWRQFANTAIQTQFLGMPGRCTIIVYGPLYEANLHVHKWAFKRTVSV